jgi:hypothetical protein
MTERGREAVLTWLRTMLSTPAREFPEFPAALAYLSLLTPEDALLQLERREQAIAEEIARIDADYHGAAGTVPRLFLIESEYLRAVLNAELVWIRSLIADLRAGRLTWNEEWLRAFAEAPETSETREERGMT